jgi:hypothetical protein
LFPLERRKNFTKLRCQVMTNVFDGEDLRETCRDIAVWVQEIPKRFGIKRKSEQWLFWLALGILCLAYAFAWFG